MTVEAGDTLGGIAARTGCSVGDLRRLNDLAGDMIRVGQRLSTAGCRVAARSGRATAGGSLAGALARRGFTPPQAFKAVVTVVEFNADRSRVARQRVWDYNGTADDAYGWNPASTVKMFPAIAAALKARRMGFSLDAELTFHGAGGPETHRLSDLIRRALGPSDNIAYNLLAVFVGFDELNGEFLTRPNGFTASQLTRAYARTSWTQMGYDASFRTAPRVTVRESGRTRVLPAEQGTYRSPCASSACTNLADLTEVMRRLMLHEQLPDSQRFALPLSDVHFIRRTLRSGRSRGQEVVDRLLEEFGDANVVCYHKAGYSQSWYSDNVYIYVRGRPEAYIVSMAGYPGRDALNEAASHIGALLAGREL